MYIFKKFLFKVFNFMLLSLFPLFKDLFLITYIYVGIYTVYECRCSWVPEELQVVVTHLAWVLGTEL